MAVRKVKGSWWVDFMYNGERLRKPSPDSSKASAEAFEVYLRQQVALHGSVEKALESMKPKKKAKPLTLAVFAEQWLRDYVDVNNKPSERYNKRMALRVHLLPTFGSLPLEAIDSAGIDEFKRNILATGLTPKSVNNYLTILRKCLGSAVEWGHLESVPHMRPLKASVPGFRYLTQVELEALLGVAKGVWRDLILFAAHTGLRFSEMAGLDWSDVDIEGRLVTVRHGRVFRQLSCPKNYRVRHVPLTKDAVLMLKVRQAEKGPVFTLNGQYVSRKTAHVHLRAYCVEAEITPHGWHALRHTFASHLTQRGASLQAIKELLGHSSIAMVLRYAHLTPKFLVDTIRLLDTKPQDLSSNCHPAHEPVAPNSDFTTVQSSILPLNKAQKDHASA